VLYFFLALFLVGPGFLWQANTACSQTQAKESAIDKAPLHVTSDKMIAQQDNSMVEFIGNVKAVRADSIVLADSIKIYFNDGKTDPGQADSQQSGSQKAAVQSSIKKIVSTGNVRYTAGERKAFADTAVYSLEDETLVLTGTAPKLITGTSFVTGKKITLFRKQEKVIVESDGTKRVEALFNPEDNVSEKP
jgi:lipopolysaccharide export system protein LptA